MFAKLKRKLQRKRYDSYEQKESSSTVYARSYSDSRSSTDSRRAAATNEMGHRVNGRPESGGTLYQVRPKSFRRPHRASLNSLGNRYAISEATEGSPRRRIIAHYQEIKSMGARNRLESQFQYSSYPGASSISPAGRELRNLEEAESSSSAQALRRHRGIEESDGGSTTADHPLPGNDTCTTQRRRTLRSSSPPHRDVSIPDTHNHALIVLNPRDIDYHSLFCNAVYPQHHRRGFVFHKCHIPIRFITVNEGSQNHRAILLPEYDYRRMRTLARMCREIHGLTGDIAAVLGGLVDLGGQRQALIFYEEEPEEFHVPGSFPDAGKEAEAEARRVLLGTLENRIRINEHALCELQDRRENVRQELEVSTAKVWGGIEISLLDEQDVDDVY